MAFNDDDSLDFEAMSRRFGSIEPPSAMREGAAALYGLYVAFRKAGFSVKMAEEMTQAAFIRSVSNQ